MMPFTAPAFLANNGTAASLAARPRPVAPRREIKSATQDNTMEIRLLIGSFHGVATRNDRMANVPGFIP